MYYLFMINEVLIPLKKKKKQNWIMIFTWNYDCFGDNCLRF
jgi:hypothetical protein